MPRQKYPSVNFFHQDFAYGVRAMPANEVGDYMRLLCAIWDSEEGKVAFDREQLHIDLRCRVSDVAKKIENLVKRGKIYIDEAGFIHNKRTDRDRAKPAKSAPSSPSTSPQVKPNLAPTSAQVEPNLKGQNRKSSAKSTPPGTSSRARAPLSSFLFPEDSSSNEEEERPNGRVDDRPEDRPPTRAISTALERYHEVAERIGLSRVEAMTETRQKKLKAILDKFGMARFEEALRRVEASDFCRGLGPRGWKANLDFLIQPSTFVKLLEGHYDNRKPGAAAGAGQTGETWQDFILNRIEKNRGGAQK